MRQIKLGLAVVAGLMTGLLAWAGSAAPDSYVKVEASSLVRSPQNSWARAILFSDVLLERPAGRVKRLDRKNYLPMKLKEAGRVWVREDQALKFQKLETGKTYSFAGTVDQISRRYYVIIDACYIIQTAKNMDDQWTDMLNPEVPAATDPIEGLQATGMQTFLVEAQNSLIQMAAKKNMTVAQLIEAQTDGGQRIAEALVADALQGELKAQQKTADEMMIGAVLALLQKGSILEESAKLEASNEALRIAEANPALPPPMLPEEMAKEVAPLPEPVSEEVAALALEEPAPESEDQLEEAPPTVEPIKGEGVVVEAEERMTEIQPKAEESVPAPVVEPIAEEVTTVTVEETLTAPEVKAEESSPLATPAGEENIAFAMGSDVSVEKVAPEKAEKTSQPEAATPMPEAGQEAINLASEVTVEEIKTARATELIAPAGIEANGDSVAAPPSSMLVIPLSESQPDMVPLVSVEPTKAELARMKKQAAMDKRERVLAEKKAAAAEAKAKKIAAKAERAEKKRLAAAEKKAEAEARAAEKARVKAEKKRVREEAAARKAAEAKAKKEAQLAEALAQKAQAEAAKQLTLEEKRALEAVAQAETLKKQAEGARLMREESEAKLAEMATRKAAAETAVREMEAKKAAALQEIRNEAEAIAAQQAAELEKRMAEEKARIAEGIRMARDVAEHEQKAAEEAATRFEAEVAARKAAEARIQQLEAETRQLEADMRQAEAQLKSELATQRKALKKEIGRNEKAARVEIDALQPQVALPKSESMTPSEKRKQKAAEKKAKKAAAREKKSRAKREAKKAAEAAAIKAQSKKKLPSSIDSGDLPEWMQPVQF